MEHRQPGHVATMSPCQCVHFTSTPKLPYSIRRRTSAAMRIRLVPPSTNPIAPNPTAAARVDCRGAMQRAWKVAAPPSRLWFRGDLQGLWQTSAMAMATKVKVDGGKNSSGIDQDSPGVNPAEREAFRDDMGKSYGGAYSERSADEGYGERYGESVKVTVEKHDTTELQRGATAKRDQKEDAVVDVEYDVSQGEHVAEKEVSRHSKE